VDVGEYIKSFITNSLMGERVRFEPKLSRKFNNLGGANGKPNLFKLKKNEKCHGLLDA